MILLIDSYFNMTLLFVWSGKDWDVWVWTHSTNTFRIEASINGINKSQVSKVIYIDSILQDHNHSNKYDKYIKSCLLVFAKFDCFNKWLETQFTNTFVLMVVPKKNFVHGKFRMSSTSNQGKNVTSEKHFNYSNSTIEFYEQY